MSGIAGSDSQVEGQSIVVLTCTGKEPPVVVSIGLAGVGLYVPALSSQDWQAMCGVEVIDLRGMSGI